MHSRWDFRLASPVCHSRTRLKDNITFIDILEDFMKIHLLADNEKYLPVIAQWYYEEWNDLMIGKTVQDEIEYLKTYLNRNEVPLILIAVENDELLGAVQLKRHEMTIYPEKEFWLGGVYVNLNYRGYGIASKLVEKAIEMSSLLGIEKLYLQTENLDGGLYYKLGWRPIEQVNYNNVGVVVMERSIS